MIGVTIGLGDEWYKVARNAAERMQEMTGLECLIISGDSIRDVKWGGTSVVHPSWLKCRILELFPDCYNEFLVFDADVICRRKWDPSGIFNTMGRAFCAVPDSRDGRVFEECNAIGFPFPDTYINGGVLIFGREHKPVWDMVWKRHPGPFGRWLEQGALNVALLDTGCEVCRLPRYFNHLIHSSQYDQKSIDISRSINLHFCGLNRAASILQIQGKLNADYSHKQEQAGIVGVPA